MKTYKQDPFYGKLKSIDNSISCMKKLMLDDPQEFDFKNLISDLEKELDEGLEA